MWGLWDDPADGARPSSPAALLHGLDKLVDETLEEGER
jgi:hypothetical protein